MLMLELFSGSKVMSDTFKRHDWDTVAIDYNPDLKPDVCKDVYTILDDESIKEICGKMPNVIWASPDCTTYSIASISTHRQREWNGFLTGKSDYAKFCDAGNKKMIDYFKSLDKDTLWFIENPRGGLRKTSFMFGVPRYTVTYCQYGDIRQKPTDIWTNHPNPNFKPCCKNGDPCHIPAPRGSRTGTQGLKGSFERSMIPLGLCEYIYTLCDEYFKVKE